VEESPPASYGRQVGPWLQYWRWHVANPQDRGILRTGRHAADWELVQVRVDRGGQPVEAVYAQHSGAERCGWAQVRTRGGAPVAYLANGSHAAYFRPGVRDRAFPDPNDEARGDGSVTRPRLVVISADSPSWMRYPGRWGPSHAHLPFEQSSPRGPAFQGERWDDPAAFAASARGCMAGRCNAVGECDNRELALESGALGTVGLLAGLAVWRRRRRRA
jgi:Vacuolar protein sorting-associated protein 62